MQERQLSKQIMISQFLPVYPSWHLVHIPGAEQPPTHLSEQIIVHCSPE